MAAVPGRPGCPNLYQEAVMAHELVLIEIILNFLKYHCTDICIPEKSFVKKNLFMITSFSCVEKIPKIANELPFV